MLFALPTSTFNNRPHLKTQHFPSTSFPAATKQHTMADQDLITYARDAASRGDDLFALLATDATASESDIRRAFRRKALTAHPDKTGDAYDPALYERIERARDVLVDAEAREAYDNGMRAVLQKKVQLDQMSQKRRQMVEELERREAEAKRAKTENGAGPRFQHDAERAAMAARGRAKMEEMRLMREQAEVRERLAREKEAADETTKPSVAPTGTPDTAGTHPDNHQPTPPPPVDADYDERIAELEKRLKEKQQRKAEKEQRKAEKKGKKAGTPVPGSPGRDASNHPPSPPAAEPQADEDKVSKPAEAASQSDTGNAPKPGGFASTMARLRAAQAKKDEEKRRKAEEAARAEGVSAS
jgi:DnaJ family protein C protein 17